MSIVYVTGSSLDLFIYRQPSLPCSWQKDMVAHVDPDWTAAGGVGGVPYPLSQDEA